ncbi:cytochrome b [Sphingosinicella microcystinivorans]|uniref:Cytochrome b n=1 Tax=Sphingosinicella microcystinivorans TaxID=335406 RepID=A0AAD1D2K5_SPHMI|nr:cytochrome b [Sphingosinicella microcystinivorans]RKS88906.1 cytochrome b561 [Sphingosinicella microcystinivorans]BBE32661.1 cytochrome b [Sphingosinicella microcystinivorans]
MAVGRSSYSKTAITLHWLIAVLVLGNIVGAVYAEGLPDAERGAIMGIHKSVGITVLALTLWRLVLRLKAGFLVLPTHMKGWEIVLARATHIGFYVLLLAIPLSGWAFAASPERPLIWFDLVPLPDSPLGKAGRGFFHAVHGPAAFLALVLVILHILGALKHHFLDRDDVLARMLPFLRKNRADA